MSDLNEDEAYKACLGVAEDLVKRHMARYDPSHDWAHVERVRQMALHIASTLPGEVDIKVVELAALFHDVAAKYTSDPISALTFTLSPFLSHPSTQISLSPAQISLILEIIPAVSWTSESKLRASEKWGRWHETCPELHAVEDADRLDAIGAIGIMRCAGFSTVKGRILLEDPNRKGVSAEEHFEEKLFRIRERMKTPFGKEEAERRHKTMVTWMEALQREKHLGE